MKQNIFLSYDPAIALLGIYPKELKMYDRTKTYIYIFTAALFITVKPWKQSRCSIGE